MYKKDAVWFGVVIGLLAPPLFYGLLFLINLAIIEVFYEHYAIRPKTMALLSIFINLLPIRVYFVNWKLDKTGRGILLVTFVLMILYFSLVGPLR